MDRPPKLVTHPLGLAGYALALVFGVIGTVGPGDRVPWFLPAAVTLATISIIGGLLLARAQINKPASKGGAKAASQSATAGPTQITTGEQSPAISNTTGDVSISYGDSRKKKK